MPAKGWTCQRVSNGQACKHKNLPRSRKCQECGKPRPAKRKPKHMDALKLSYEEYVELNGGLEQCGICGAPPDGRRLDRDHDHRSGAPRGLLCRKCNRGLVPSKFGLEMTPEWHRQAAAYIERAEGRAG